SPPPPLPLDLESSVCATRPPKPPDRAPMAPEAEAGIASQQIPRPLHRPLADAIQQRPPAPFLGADPFGEADIVLEQGMHLRTKFPRSHHRRYLAVIFDAAVIQIG